MKESILIIDDEKDICFLMSQVLKKKYTVEFANTLSEAYRKLIVMQPSVIFLDLNLPDGSGMDAISKIRKLQPDSKIIIISAYDSNKERNLAKKRGAHVFIQKPFNNHVIDSSLEKLQSLGKKQN